MINEKFTIANISDCLDNPQRRPPQASRQVSVQSLSARWAGKLQANKMPGMTEADLRQATLEFSSIDPRVESFLKKNAEEFARQHFTATSYQLSAASSGVEQAESSRQSTDYSLWGKASSASSAHIPVRKQKAPCFSLVTVDRRLQQTVDCCSLRRACA